LTGKKKLRKLNKGEWVKGLVRDSISKRWFDRNEPLFINYLSIKKGLNSH
jgi:hypothetical protein|tara:strand:+ start:888 stop:1037 length:150 start_codon:yes stop_codon:yes gene_type:complete